MLKEILSHHIKSEQCRQKTLLEHFQATFSTISPSHLCCDVCASKCTPGLPECHESGVFAVETAKKQCYIPQKSRQASLQQKEMVQNVLNVYHNHLDRHLVHHWK